MRQTTTEALPDPRWQAVLARDRRQDGCFVYAVRSTHIYCRPSCPSRRPLRERVLFFAAPAEAERAGFRACLRCHPAEDAAEDVWAARIRQACALLRAHSTSCLTLAQLSARVGGSPWHLQRRFSELVGLSPREYYAAGRMNRLKQQLKKGATVADAVYGAGFGSASRVYEHAVDHLGMTPASYRRGGAGATIGFTVVPCPLGSLLVAATGAGVCSVRMGDDGGLLEAELRREFPAARVEQSEGLAGIVREILSCFADRPASPVVSIDVRATVFQRQVWRALMAIPRGQTATYGEVARAIGRPRASRAVARACATNPVALLVPCHRVVRADGRREGYRWGEARKTALLALEGARPRV